jgi:hypothetical protein
MAEGERLVQAQARPATSGCSPSQSNLPALVAPALDGLLILVSNWLGIADVAYRAIFGVAAASLVCGILVVRRIRLPA